MLPVVNTLLISFASSVLAKALSISPAVAYFNVTDAGLYGRITGASVD